MAKDDPHFRLRIPEDMKKRIEIAASENQRSINAEILYRLQTTLDMDEYVPEVNAHIETEDEAFNRARSLLNEVDALLANANKLRKGGDK
ncbi:Arc family DNA-binding protein [Brucella sp. 191011898]|uniref:Arc family DNA-binding protein n=1 Tax=Brucella sp. 191011898 TaxID=2730447 RepID=UPI0015DFA49E|nr:Arc family DNA-binding protein [Brucella sp. 191011898]